MEKEFVASVTISLAEYNSMKMVYEQYRKEKRVYSVMYDYRIIQTMNESETVAMIGEFLVKVTNEKRDIEVKLYDAEQKLKAK